MVRAFHWQYGDILLAIYFLSFYYVVLSLKNKYTILYYTVSHHCHDTLACDHSACDRLDWSSPLSRYHTIAIVIVRCGVGWGGLENGIN